MAEIGKLNSIQLSGFKSIKEMDLTLSNLNILIGPNGAGKSNFINFFKFMNKILSKDLQFYLSEKGTAESFLYFGSQITREVKIDLKFDPNEYKAVLKPTVDGKLVFESETVVFDGDKAGYSGGRKYHEINEAGNPESGLPQPGSYKPPHWVAAHLSDWKIYHFHDTSETARVKKPGEINNNLRLAPQGENLAAFLYSIQDTPSYKKIVQTIQRMAPFFHDFILTPDKNNEEQIRLRWKQKGSDKYFDANSLSDGTIRFICLTTLLLQPELPKVILLDEPELGLHPYAIQLLAGMFKSASTKTQIIASTQSVTLANQFSWEDMIIVEQIDNASKFRRLHKEEVEVWLEEYRMGDIWEKNLIGGTP